MRKLELNIYNKVKSDFSAEIELLEKGLDTIVMCGQLLAEQSDYADKPNLRNELLNANQNDRCLTTQILLIQHAITFLKAARLLLLTGYIGPSLSCLRTAFESFQNSHICLESDDQAISLLKGKHLNKKLDINYPIQLDKTTGREIKRTLANYGVHANYEAIETQALYEGSIFIEENKATYEFILLRNIYSFLTIALLLLDYLLDSKQVLMKEYPDAVNIARDISRKIPEIAQRLADISSK